MKEDQYIPLNDKYHYKLESEITFSIPDEPRLFITGVAEFGPDEPQLNILTGIKKEDNMELKDYIYDLVTMQLGTSKRKRKDMCELSESAHLSRSFLTDTIRGDHKKIRYDTALNLKAVMPKLSIDTLIDNKLIIGIPKDYVKDIPGQTDMFDDKVKVCVRQDGIIKEYYIEKPGVSEIFIPWDGDHTIDCTTVRLDECYTMIDNQPELIEYNEQIYFYMSKPMHKNPVFVVRKEAGLIRQVGYIRNVCTANNGKIIGHIAKLDEDIYEIITGEKIEPSPDTIKDDQKDYYINTGEIAYPGEEQNLYSGYCVEFTKSYSREPKDNMTIEVQPEEYTGVATIVDMLINQERLSDGRIHHHVHKDAQYTANEPCGEFVVEKETITTYTVARNPQEAILKSVFNIFKALE